MANDTENKSITNPWRKIGMETIGLGAAEFTSMAVSLGVVGTVDAVAPDLMKSVSKSFAKTFIEPHLDTLENGLKKFCKLEECQPDPNKSKEERAEQLAHTIIVFGTAWAASMAAKLATRKGMRLLMEKKQPEHKTKTFLKLDAHDWKVLGADELVHLGAFFMVNNGAAKHTDNAIRATSSIFQKTFGMTKDRADAVSSMAVVWELPNALGFVAGTGVIAHDAFKAEREAQKTIQAALTKGNGHAHTP